MANNYLIEQTAGTFWTLAGPASSFPRDMQTAITLASPLELYSIPDLHISHVLAWARHINMACHIRDQHRRLHGCLVAWRGKGIIFFDQHDPDHEQRFTLAHELAHFLLDYEALRLRAVDILGSSILPVLDGERPPTNEDRLQAVLDNVSIGVMSHLMERPDKGLPIGTIIDVENRADRLALELLAPAHLLDELIDQPPTPKGFQARLAFLTQHLTTSYGLPADISTTYARFLLVQRGEPTFRDWLFGTL